MPLGPKTESARLQEAAAHGLARAEAAMPAGDLDLWPTSWQAQKIAKVAAMTTGYVRSFLRGSLESLGVRTTTKFGNSETRRRERTAYSIARCGVSLTACKLKPGTLNRCAHTAGMTNHQKT